MGEEVRHKITLEQWKQSLFVQAILGDIKGLLPLDKDYTKPL